MRDFCRLSNPDANFHFRRRWADDPLDGRGLEHLGREVAPRILDDVGRRAIRYWLRRASKTQNGQAAEAFRQADLIRQKFGWTWKSLIDRRVAA